MGREGIKVLLQHPFLAARIHFSGMVAILFSPSAEYLGLFGIPRDSREHAVWDVSSFRKASFPVYHIFA